MSSEEANMAVDQPQADDASAPKSSRTRPSSTVAAAPANPKKKVARPSVPGAKNGANGTGGVRTMSIPVATPHRTYKHGDLVLARLKGYPPWPARIADPEGVPAGVKAARPNAAGRPSGSATKSSLYAVEFFPAGDYSWMNARDIEPLSTSAITDFLSSSHRKTGELKKGYETAQDPKDWDARQKKYRQEKEEAANQVDELEDEDELADTSASKRKKAPKEKSKKKAKTSKAEVEEEEDAPAPKATKAKADKSKAAPAAKAEPAPADDDPLSSDPECVKVKDWRHKLQRAFLGKAPPTADEMPTYDTLFKTIEEYKNITIDALTYSKIGKVMKKIGTLTNVARDEEFKLTERATKLMSDWQEIVSGGKTEGADANGNGDATKEAEAAKPAAEAEAATEPEQKAADPAVNGTGEGEGDAEKTEAEPKADAEATPA